MAVQVPSLQRMNPQDTASVGRIGVSAPDLAKPMEMQAKAADSLVDTTGKVVQQQVQLAADTTATQAANEMHQYLETGLQGPNGAKWQKGDPTDVYKTFDANEEKKAQEIQDRYKDASDETQSAISRKIGATRAMFFDRKTTARGLQSDNYQISVTNDAVELAKNDMMDATAHLDPADGNTLVPMDQAMNRIYDLRVKSGLKNGSVKPVLDPKGEIDPDTGTTKVIGYDMDPSLKLQLAKDRSDGIYKAINNLSASGDVDGAKFLTEKYQQYLDPVNRAKAEEKTVKASVDATASQEARKVQNMPPEQAMTALSKIDDPKVREKAMANLATFNRQMETAKKQSEDKNYNIAGKAIIDRQNSGQPFTDVNDMLSNPSIKRVWDNIQDPKKKMALEHLVDAPKESDHTQLNKAYNVLYENADAGGTSLRGMSPGDFNQLMAGLNKSDRNIFEKNWRNVNSQTPGEQNQMVKNMGSQLTKELQTLGYVKKNDFGKYSNADQVKLNQANDELVASLDKLPQNLSLKEQNAYVQKLAATKKSGEVFNPSAAVDRPKFQGTIKPVGQPTTTSVAGVIPPVDLVEQKKNAMKSFYKEFKRWPDPVTELPQYMKKIGL